MTYNINMDEESYRLVLKQLEYQTKEKGIYKVACEMNVTPKTLYRAFKGESDPSFKSVAKLCEVLGIVLYIDLGGKR